MSDTANGVDDVALRAPGGFAWIPPQALPWVVCGLLAVAVGAVYGRSLGTPFVFDDRNSVLSNGSIKKLWPLLGGPPGTTPLSPPKFKPTSGRPVVNLSLAVNYAIGGLNPVGYRMFNLAVHVLAALLLWAIVRRTLRLDHFQGRFDRVAEPLAFLVALVWALHPLQIDAVQYVTQRTELIMGLFYLGTMYASLRYFTTDVPQQRTTWCVLAAAACVLGMGCKEVMVTAPVMVLLFERTFIAGSFRKALKGSWPLYVGLALGWLFLLALNYHGPRSETAGFNVEGSDYIPPHIWWLKQSKAVMLYLTLSIWPWPLAIHYEIPFKTLPEVFVPLLIVAVLGINTVVRLWQRDAVGFLGAWFFIILSPTLVVPIVTEPAAERRMYLPLAAIVTLVIVGGYALLQRVALRRKSETGARGVAAWPLGITTLCALIVVTVFAILDWRRLAIFKSPLALWQDTVANQPDSFLAQLNLARALLRAGREQEANALLTQLEPLAPYKVQFYWARMQIGAGQPQNAIEHVDELMKLKPSWVPGLRQLVGVSLINHGQLQAGVQQLEEAARLAPNNAEHHRNLGMALIKAGRPQESIEPLKRALELEPGSVEVQQNLAKALKGTRRSEEAIQRLRKALEREPESAQLHVDLGSALFDAGRFDEAIEEFQEALRLKPAFAAAQFKLERAIQAKQQ